jgi:two-component system sensor histidine kinase/response regulator
MKEPRRLLLLEDDPFDAQLLRRTLSARWPNCEIVEVDSERGFQENLTAGGFDLILSDYCVAGFHGLSALALAQQQCPHVPVIFVSGAIGDEIAVESLKAGATDYVLKDRLVRLVPAVERALKESEDRARRERAEAARHATETKLEQINQDLLRRNEEIQNFYHTLSHELKTPLTSAREFISIVIDGLAGPISDAQAEYLGIAVDSCNQLRMCIDDLLDATKLDTGKLALELKPMSIGSLVHRVVARMRPTATEKLISLGEEIEPGLPEVAVDEHRLTQVLTNLVNNAIKYTPARGRILIKAGEAHEHPQLIEISVSDTGRGIPQAEQDRIFDRLYQVKAGDAATEQGVGLGLYLCRELVQLHGGQIRVESVPGKGSTFSFVLPKSQDLLQPSLLIIDDDADLLEMLRLVLMGEHYHIRTAPNGRAGLAEMRRQTPDIVMLDLAMPEITGAATLKEIRRDWGQIPVIVHTGFVDGELMNQAMECSPFTLLAKPCPPEQVLATIRKVQRADDTAVWHRNHCGLRKPAFR